MKALIVAVAAAIATAPAFAQAPADATMIEVEGGALIRRYVALFNRGDVAGLAKEVYAKPDEATLAAKFEELRADSFGKLDPYGAAYCAVSADRGKALLTFAKIYTFGGKMDDDEAKVFDLAKTPEGWRIVGETDVAFDTTLRCY